MVEGRQADLWAMNSALSASVSNLFASKDERIDVLQFVPPHLMDGAGESHGGLTQDGIEKATALLAAVAAKKAVM